MNKRLLASFSISMILLGSQIIPTSAACWNSRDHVDVVSKTDHTMITPKLHNYIVEIAIQWLIDAGKLPFDAFEETVTTCPGDCLPEMDGMGFVPKSAINFIDYGVWYADHVWAGPPEYAGVRVAGVNNWRFEQAGTYIVDREQWGYKWIPFWTPPLACPVLNNIFVQTGYTQYFEDELVNPYFLAQTSVMFGIDGLNKPFGADNYYHYKGDEITQELNVALPGTLPILNGTTAFQNSVDGLGADSYGATLYQLAKDFWPGNRQRTPSMDRFVEYDAAYTGEIHLFNQCAHPWSPRRRMTAKYMSFYQGGNPFICESNGDTDWCRDGRPTWPLWVPDYDKVVDFDSPDSVAKWDYREELLKPERARSKRAAFIYLGWALHMLGDLSQPDHVLGRTGMGHPIVEDDADDLAPPRSAIPYFDSSDSEFAGIEDKTYSEMCEDFDLSNGTDSEIKAVFDEMADFADNYHGEIHNSLDVEDAVQDLMNKAVKQTIKLVACLGPCAMYIENEVIQGVPPLYYSCLIEAGAGVTINSGAEVVFEADDYIKLLPGVTIKKGSSFHARIK